MESIKVKHPSF